MADDSVDAPSSAPSLEDTILQFLSLVGPAGTAPSVFSELCDGVFFFDVLHHLDAAHFDVEAAGLKREAHDNALLRISNLRKLVAALQAFFATSNLFGTPDVDLSFLNVPAIGQAAGGSGGELLKLAELVVTAAVNSSAKEAVVAHIMELSEDQQHQLMFIINEVMEKHAPPDEAAVAAGASSLGTPGLRPLDAPSPRHSLSPRHAASGRDESRELKELREAVAETRPKLDRLTDENRELRRSLAVAEEKLAELTANVKRQVTEAVSAAQKALAEEKTAEVNKAKRQAESLERRVAEMSLELTRATEHGDSLGAKLREDLEAQRLENRKLHDELDLANEKARQLVQAEATIERYKARLGELAEVRAQLKEYEEQQGGHLERIAELEAEAKQVPTLKQQLAKQKDEQTVLKDRLYQHELAEQELHDKLEHLRETQAGHEAEIKRISEERDQMRAELNAAREHGGDSGGSSLLGRTQSISDLTGSLGGSSITEKLLKLEAENRELRAKAAAAGSEDGASVEQLKEELESTKRQLNTLQEKHRETNKQLLKLQTQASAAPAPTAGPPAGSDDDKRRLAGEVAALQERLVTLMEENSTLKDKAKADEKRQSDYDALQKRCKELSEYGKKAKDELKKRNEVITKLTEQNQALVTKSRLDGGAGADGNSATVKTLNQQLLDARAEIEQFKKLREEYKAVTKREMQLMSSAFYSIGTELQTQVHLYGKGRAGPTQSGSASGSTPHRNSWLNKQRGIVRH